MYRETAGLVMYGQLGKDSILMKLGSLVEKMEHDDSYSREELVRAIYDEVYRLLDLSTTYGFDNNLWQCYIAYLLATTENPFSILCETVGPGAMIFAIGNFAFYKYNRQGIFFGKHILNILIDGRDGIYISSIHLQSYPRYHSQTQHHSLRHTLLQVPRLH